MVDNRWGVAGGANVLRSRNALRDSVDAVRWKRGPRLVFEAGRHVLVECMLVCAVQD